MEKIELSLNFLLNVKRQWIYAGNYRIMCVSIITTMWKFWTWPMDFWRISEFRHIHHRGVQVMFQSIKLVFLAFQKLTCARSAIVCNRPWNLCMYTELMFSQNRCMQNFLSWLFALGRWLQCQEKLIWSNIFGTDKAGRDPIFYHMGKQPN